VLQIGRDEIPEAIKTLQRALERECEREEAEAEARWEGAGAARQEETVREVDDEGAGVSRAGSVRSEASFVSHVSVGRDPTDSGWTSSDYSSARRSAKPKDTLDREFMEGGIDALRRLSRGTDVTVPSWTITRYEIDRDVKIGMGFFSDVYRGTWRGRTVAIKVLTPATPRELFRREVEIWKTFTHRNVLPLYGASSASGDPPWFFVSPYYKNGSLIAFLKGLGEREWEGWNLLKAAYEIARGMSYLHGKGILHGDLKVCD
jgi:abelson tyrosine-protein kinase 1